MTFRYTNLKTHLVTQHKFHYTAEYLESEADEIVGVRMRRGSVLTAFDLYVRVTVAVDL